MILSIFINLFEFKMNSLFQIGFKVEEKKVTKNFFCLIDVFVFILIRNFGHESILTVQ
jgi:hypothetical protein